MKMIKKEVGFIQKWNVEKSYYLDSIFKYIETSHALCERYCESKNEVNDNSFNFFTIISDLYYRENFHSDIIRFLLDPTEKHGCESLFLMEFLNLLKTSGNEIEIDHYNDVVVKREETIEWNGLRGNIDILVLSESNRRAIIIENKIYNAGDTYYQIPKYYHYIKSLDYIVDAIVYLPLDISKTPDKSDWKEEDIRDLEKLIVVVPAYAKGNTINIVNNWLNPSIEHISNPDVKSFLKQYSHLITLLNNNIMDTVIMKEFYEELMKENNLYNALSIRNMLDELPTYLAFRISEKYKTRCFPFQKIWQYKSSDAVFEGAVINGIYLKMDIWCSMDGYNVLFWTPDDKDEKTFFQLINQIPSLSSFDRATDYINRVVKQFGITEEDELCKFIEGLLKDMILLNENR